MSSTNGTSATASHGEPPAARGEAARFGFLLGGGKKKVVQVAGVHKIDAPVRFIAVGRAGLLERLTAHEYWEGHDRAAVKDVLHCLGRLRQQESCVRLDQLMDAYQPFNPDNALKYSKRLTWEEKAELKESFLAGIEQLVFRANFTPIRREELDVMLSKTSPYGVEVDVDLDEFEPLLPYYRGVNTEHRSSRDWRWAYLLKTHYSLPSYERLFLALTLKPAEKRIGELQAKHKISRRKAEKKLRKARSSLPAWVDSEEIYLKMFKDVPQLDIDMLLPAAGVRFNPFDRFMLWISGGGSAIYALVVAVLKILAVAVSPVLLIMTLFGFGGALWRQISSVLNTRNRYMMELSQKLYFHNMSNNQGVLTLLVDESEEEDIKEESLLYAFLLNTPVPRSNFHSIKLSVESFVKREFGVVTDFDHEEALARLKARGIAHEVHGEILAMPAAEAAIHLRRQWNKAIEVCADGFPPLNAMNTELPRPPAPEPRAAGQPHESHPVIIRQAIAEAERIGDPL
jgi:hypothetical protein